MLFNMYAGRRQTHGHSVKKKPPWCQARRESDRTLALAPAGRVIRGLDGWLHVIASEKTT